jgi:hypothetical protein
VLERDLPRAHSITELSRVWTRSYTGCEMLAIMSRAVDETGREVERRRVAIYEVFGFFGAVMMAGTPRDFERHAEMIDRVMRSGRPQTWPPNATEWLPQTA